MPISAFLCTTDRPHFLYHCHSPHLHQPPFSKEDQPVDEIIFLITFTITYIAMSLKLHLTSMWTNCVWIIRLHNSNNISSLVIWILSAYKLVYQNIKLLIKNSLVLHLSKKSIAAYNILKSSKWVTPWGEQNFIKWIKT